MSKMNPGGGLLEGEHYQLICGGRDFVDAKWIKNHLERVMSKLEGDVVTIVTGGARGADRLATDVAESMGFQTIVIEADWDNDGKRAGYLRNERMAGLLDSFRTRGAGVSVVYFPGGRGTEHMRKIAHECSLPVFTPVEQLTTV